ncbi:MAG: DUF4387 domain-containing protein [Oscillospiraceae bacterium]|nr:DUF4387 domain-containing protein [Oscillospiraceae bacterium]
MKTLKDIATVIRSKNAGPYELTLDVIFSDRAVFEDFCAKKIFCKEVIAKLYHIEETDVLSIVEFPPAMAVKATIVRPIASGALGERDVYGAQQHVPLMDLTIDD